MRAEREVGKMAVQLASLCADKWAAGDYPGAELVASALWGLCTELQFQDADQVPDHRHVERG